MSHRLAIAAIALAAPLALGACAAGDHNAQSTALTPDQLALLDRHLGGKVAGQPVSCLTSSGTDETIRVADNILLYRVSGRLVYKNELRSSCPGMARDTDIIVTQTTGSGPCRGDIIHLVDRTSGIRGPSCTLGDFVPYRTPAGQ
jgi:hypothetical protein